jgi:ligand-binding sensor domain-containing protein
MMKLKFFAYLVLLSFLVLPTFGQLTPVGNWQTHFSYNSTRSVECIGDKIFAAGTHLYAYSISENEFSTYSKVNGLHDIDIRLLRYNPKNDYLVIVYANSNIDLYHDNVFTSISDLKNLNITGSKRINNITFVDNLIYLSTDFGIVVMNPEKKEIKETYTLQSGSQVLQVRDLALYRDSFYAATSAGIYVADKNNPVLQNFANWKNINTLSTNFIFTQNEKLFSATDDSLFSVNDHQLNYLYSTAGTIQRIRTGNSRFYTCESGNDVRRVSLFDQSGVWLDTIKQVNPMDLVEYTDNQVWIADLWEGLARISNVTDKQLIVPNSVFDNTVYNMSIYNDDLYIAGGAERSWIYTFSSSGFARYRNGTWQTFNRHRGTASMDSTLDILDVAIDPVSGHAYLASYGGGLVELNMDNNTSTVYKNTDYIQAALGNPGANLVVGFKFDADKNLWISNYAAPEQLVVKKRDGSWQKFGFPYSTSERTASQIEIDNANQKWMVAPRGIGIFVLNDNNTIDNKNDDQIKKLTTGIGYGNLPNNEVYCITKDKDGKMWVGTADGIAIFNCPESTFSTQGCDAELKVVKYDLNAGLLFQREAVKTIAVDGGNNKWIGTNNGVWLISDDAEKIIHHFNKDNSPLPNNEVTKIVVHPKTGEVFIATNSGLVSYRGEATEGSENNDELSIFPNPVPSNYGGVVAIKGLVENADVRITDVAGQLVYRTKASGGQAVWNGKTYLGKKPSTGVYYVFVTNSDGSEAKSGKFIYNE